MSVRRAVSCLVSLLARCTPKSNSVVVHGFPSTEGNAAEVVRYLGRMSNRRVVWLDGLESEASQFSNVSVVPKSSFRGVWCYARASLIFFTHGIYGGATAGRRATTVNLWHGDGIKVKDWTKEGTVRPRSDYVVGGTLLLTAQKAKDFLLPECAIIVSGNPRVDAFSRPAKESVLENLGIDPRKPFVVWLPTFRQSRTIGQTSGRSDVEVAEQSQLELRNCGSELGRLLSAHGWQLIVKPHPMDAWSYSDFGALEVTDADLQREEISLYQLLGSSSALITDFSSVWTDYLVLDRCIGFLVPDLNDYKSGRGLYPDDITDWLPGRIARSADEMGLIVEDILSYGHMTESDRNNSRRKLGLVSGESCVDALFEQLTILGVWK